MRFFPNGIGGSLGDQLVTTSPLYIAGDVWYVHAPTGTDAVTPAGKNREKPLATLAQAHTNAANGDVIVFLDGHTQTLTAAQTISKSVTLVGEGQASGKPTVKFTNNQAAGEMFNVTGTSVSLRNIWIEENLAATASARIIVAGVGFEMIGCYVECGANDQGTGVQIDASRALFRNCTFISTATSTAGQPGSAAQVRTVSLTDITFEGCTFSDGTVGFSGVYALDASEPVARLRGENVSLLLGADAIMGVGTTGYFIVTNSTGGGRVDWS